MIRPETGDNQVVIKPKGLSKKRNLEKKKGDFLKQLKFPLPLSQTLVR